MNTKGTVLIVEDNVKILDANRRLLEEEGCAVVIAQTIWQARKILESADIDAAVLDISLPDGNAFDELFPDLRDKYKIPVLFLSCLKTHDVVNAALRAGGFDYMRKPYDDEEFCLRVTRMLDISQERRLKTFYLESGLNDMEMSIARLILEDMGVKQIADRVHLSESRARTILTSIYRKLNIEGPDGSKRKMLSEMLAKNGIGIAGDGAIG